MISDIALSTRTFFLPTLSESIFVVSAANRARLVSKYSWCGQPRDLEKEERRRGAKGTQGKADLVVPVLLGGPRRWGEEARVFGFGPNCLFPAA